MSTLVERDKIENGGSGVLTTHDNEVEELRLSGAKRWKSDIRKYRVGCTIGPIHYFETHDGYLDGTRLDECPEIDLKPTISALSKIKTSMTLNGYACYLSGDLKLTIDRRNSKVFIKIVALAWVNDNNEIQIIGEPNLSSIQTIDEDGSWLINGMGPGIDLGFRYWPDMLRPVIRINDPSSLPRPTIGPIGLRLAKIMKVGWEDGRIPIFSHISYKSLLSDSILSGSFDEHIVEPGIFPIESGMRQNLWFQDPLAWDNEQTWRMREEWMRQGEDVQAILSLPIEAVLEARGALLLDETMAEQQVGAASDDGYVVRSTSTPKFSIVIMYFGDYDAANFDYEIGVRFASVPIGAGSIIDTATLSLHSGSLFGTVASSTIYGEASDSPATYSTFADFDARPRTFGEEWSPGSWVADTWYTASGIPLQPIVDRSGRASGDPVAFHVTHAVGWGAATSLCQAHTYESSAPLAPKLNATYTVASAGGIPPAIRIAINRGIPGAINKSIFGRNS